MNEVVGLGVKTLALKPEDWQDLDKHFHQAAQFLQARAEYHEYLELKIARERALGDEHRAFLDERIAELVNNGQPNKWLYVGITDPDGGQASC